MNNIYFFFEGTVGNDTRSSGGKDAVTLIIVHYSSRLKANESNIVKDLGALKRPSGKWACS